MVQMVGGTPDGDVDGDRFSLELPTNQERVIVCDRIDLDMYDGSLHRRILRAEQR
jgi:hypothetical protein